MSSDARTAQEQLTPEERRSMLRAFADRMLLKITAMDDPEDMPGAERCVCMASAIERIYSRCDRAERSTPDPRKLEAERAKNARDAIHARDALASAISIQKINRKNLGDAWDSAGELIKTGTQKPAPAPAQTPAKPQTPAPVLTPAAAPLPGLPAPGVATPALSMPAIEVADYTDIIEKAIASGLRLRRNDPHSASP